MAVVDAELDQEIARELRLRAVEEELKESYINYAMSVIVGRAIPDARDGFKPVHRRILYGMHELGLSHNKPFKKCARIVGEVLGKYHPHGDAAVYDALVRMAQDFSMRYPMVEGQGNFGSIDGDSPAAMRYTEARLSRIAELMLQDIDKDTVNFENNFDASLKEPVVLPAKFPNLLVNGSTGIAVGMATNMPPHNLREVVDAIIATIDRPEITIEELMGIIKGPDFPTGGIVHGRAGLLSAYMKGRGTIKIRGRTHIERVRGRNAIIITEIPYAVNKAKMLEEIANHVKNKVIVGISDIRDESDRTGIRVVIELKKDVMPEIVLNNLYKHSKLEVTYGIINLALVDRKPRVLNLRELIDVFVKHRFEVVRRRVKHELERAERRHHIVLGLIIAVENIDRVIEIIRSSKDVSEAKEQLIKIFGLSEEQAKSVLEMRLQKLTSMEIHGLMNERDTLQAKIKDFRDILANEARVYDIIKQELIEIKETFGDDRKTEISKEDFETFVDEDLIPNDEVVVTITRKGYIKRIPIDTYRSQGRGGKGLKGMQTREEDYVIDLFISKNHDYLMFFTNLGKAYWLKTYKLPTGTRHSLGKPIVNLLPRLEEGERIQATIPISAFEEDKYLFFATRNGYVKKTQLSAFSHPTIRGIRAIILDKDDELIDVKMTDGNKEVILASKFGYAVRFHEVEVRPMGRATRGVIGMRLRYGDYVVSMTVVDESLKLLTITEKGYGKRTPTTEYRRTHRGSHGVITCKITPKNGYVVDVMGVKDDDELIVLSRKGMVIRIRASDISIHGRATMGVRLMRLDEGDLVQSIAVVRD